MRNFIRRLETAKIDFLKKDEEWENDDLPNFEWKNNAEKEVINFRTDWEAEVTVTVISINKDGRNYIVSSLTTGEVFIFEDALKASQKFLEILKEEMFCKITFSNAIDFILN